MEKPHCPRRLSAKTVKTGTRRGKQRRLCKACGRSFTENPTNKVIDAATREQIPKLLAERLSSRAMNRFTDVSLIKVSTPV